MQNNLPIIHIMDVVDPWFTYIRDKIKPVEGRRMSSKWLKIKIGDKILMQNKVTNQYFMVDVIDIKYFPANVYNDPLTSYLLGVGINNALPGVDNLYDARNIYLQWSTENEIKTQGFMGIYIKF